MNFLFPLERFTDVSVILAPLVRNFARALNANIHLLRVEPLMDQYLEMRVKDAKEWIDRFVDEHLKKVSVHKSDVIIGDPAEEILKYIDKHEIDCVIIGTLGKKRPGELFFGGTAKEIVAKSTVPVMTINPYLLTESFLMRNAGFFKNLFLNLQNRLTGLK